MTFFGFSDDAPETTDDTIWNWDDTRTIGIGLAPSGELIDIEITAEWRRTVPEKRLAASILATYSGALAMQLEQARQTKHDVVASDGETSLDSEEVGFELYSRMLQERHSYVVTYDQKFRAEIEFPGSNRNLVVTAMGGSPVSIFFDKFWLSISNGKIIAQELMPLLARAIRSGAEIDREMREEFPAVAEFRRMMALEERQNRAATAGEEYRND